MCFGESEASTEAILVWQNTASILLNLSDISSNPILAESAIGMSDKTKTHYVR